MFHTERVKSNADGVEPQGRGQASALSGLPVGKRYPVHNLHNLHTFVLQLGITHVRPCTHLHPTNP